MRTLARSHALTHAHTHTHTAQALDQQLRHHLPSASLPPLPSTSWVRSFDPAYINRKQRALNGFLHSLLASPPPLCCAAPIISFLHPHPQLDTDLFKRVPAALVTPAALVAAFEQEAEEESGGGGGSGGGSGSVRMGAAAAVVAAEEEEGQIPRCRALPVRPTGSAHPHAHPQHARPRLHCRCC